jgi:hypothetical protein
VSLPVQIREWIIQRCTQRWNGSELLYEDWIGAELFDGAGRQMGNIELMTRPEMIEGLEWCAKRWPDDEFRGHNVANCRCKQHAFPKCVARAD